MPNRARIASERRFISATRPGLSAVAMRTFSKAVSELNRLWNWKMKPASLRSATRAARPSRTTS